MQTAANKANQLFGGNWSETIQSMTVEDNQVILRLRVSALGYNRDATGYAQIQPNASNAVAEAMDTAQEVAMNKAIDSFSSQPAAQPQQPAQPPQPAVYQNGNQGYTPVPEVIQVLCNCQRAMRKLNQHGQLFDHCWVCDKEQKGEPVPPQFRRP